MGKYNFDEFIDRRDSHSIKWDLFGDGILPLWVADMDFASPPEIIRAMRKRLQHPIFGYQSCDQEYLEIICEWIVKEHGWKISPEDILLMPGVVTGLNWVVDSLCEKNDSILFNTPVYFPFYKLSKNNDVMAITIPLKNTSTGYEIDFNRFEKSIRDDTRIFILCNPHNPVGRVFRKEELERIGKICLDHKILICSDEIHCDLVFPGHKHIPIGSISEDLSNNTITLMAPSKTFNIPGLHSSFAIVQNEDLRDQLCNNRGGIIGEPNILAQTATKAAFEHGKGWLIELIDYLDKNRKYAINFLRDFIPEIKFHSPEGTYLLWLDCSGLNLGEAPFDFFLKNAKVGLNKGESFGKNSKEFVRLNFACSRGVLNKALDRLAKSLAQRPK